MVTEIEGSYDGSGMQVALVVSDFNARVTQDLQQGALETLRRAGVVDGDITVYHVPGAFEIPGMVRQILDHTDPDGVMCLGTIIRGDTPHFDYVCSAVTSGVRQLNLQYDTPVLFGVLTTDTLEQAQNRAGMKSGNKGSETALSLVQQVHSYRSVRD